MPSRYRGDRSKDWFYEGNVAVATERYLKKQGWKTFSILDPATRMQGVDLIIEQGGARLLVEVKGYPSRTYADPLRAAEFKPTVPSTQARHWFSQALLGVVLRRDSVPDAIHAVALPDMVTYRQLIARAKWAFKRLRIAVFVVDDAGQARAEVPLPRPTTRPPSNAGTPIP